MTADVISFDDLTRDRKAFRLRLAGMSTLRIAEELRCSLDQVEASLARACCGVTADLTSRTIQLELDRLDEMQAAHYAKMKEGSVSATAIMLKIMEHRARLLGLIAPPRSDDALGIAMAEKESSIDKIERLLDEIAGAHVIEGEVVQSPTAGGESAGE